MMGPKPAPVQERLLARAVRLDNGCLVIVGNLRNGYGQTRIGSMIEGTRRTVSAHRAIYEALVGPIPEGMVIDHLCHNADPECPGGAACQHRACIEISHLAVTTRRENLLRGSRAIGHVAWRTGRCRNGHDLTDPSVAYISPGGARRCRVCSRRKKET